MSTTVEIPTTSQAHETFLRVRKVAQDLGGNLTTHYSDQATIIGAKVEFEGGTHDIDIAGDYVRFQHGARQTRHARTGVLTYTNIEKHLIQIKAVITLKAKIKASRQAQEDAWAANTKRVIDAKIDFWSEVTRQTNLFHLAGRLDFEADHDRAALGPFAGRLLTETKRTAGATTVTPEGIVWTLVYSVGGSRTRFFAETPEKVIRIVRGLDALFAA